MPPKAYRCRLSRCRMKSIPIRMARMPACSWPQEYEIGFVKNHLGPALQQSGLPTKIWMLDHNYNLWGRAICELDEEGLRKYCNAIAFHGYVGTPGNDGQGARRASRRATVLDGRRSRLHVSRSMQPNGPRGGRRSRRQFDTGARRSADGTWRSTKKAGPTLDRFRVVEW